MKIQDVGFLITLLLLLFARKRQMFLYAGLVCFVVAIPLFARWIFFTGERLVWYGAAFIALFVLSHLFFPHQKE